MPRNFQNRQKSSDIFRLKISLCTQPLLSPGRNVSFALTVFRRSQKHAVTCKHFQGDSAEKCQLEEVGECGGCRNGQDSKCPHLNKHALCSPVDCSPPGSSVHGILQARVLEWVVISFSKGIFLTQGSNPSLLHFRETLDHLSQGYSEDYNRI